MFLGRHAHTLDAKGRMAIPARFRDELADGLVVTRGVDHCLAIYPMAAWNELAAKINALPVSDADARTFRRMVFAEAIDLVLDAQGRILVPSELRAYAQIDRDAVVIGVHSFIEVWSPERWNTARETFDADGSAIVQRLAGLV
jgi:MraZ protein